MLKVSKSFTLIELLVTIGIVIVIAAASGPALDSERQRSNLDSAVKQIRDGINQTQTYAQAPESSDATDYAFVLNKNAENDASWNSVTIGPHEYAIFAMVPTDPTTVPPTTSKILIKKSGKIASSNITLTDNASSGYHDGSDLFKIHFRVPDGLAGCASVYYGDPLWNRGATCNYTVNPYAEITVASNASNTQTKTIKIQKVSGEIET